MSKKNTKLLQKFISILACVALLAISIIPVNNIYAEDTTTNNGENTQETSEGNTSGNTSETTDNTTGTNTNNEDGGDTTDPSNQDPADPSNQDPADPQTTTTNEENNQSAPMKLMAPKAGGPLKAPIPGRPEDVEIILSNDTSGEYTSGADWEWLEERAITVNLKQMQQGHTYTLEIEVADGMYVSKYAFDKSLGTKSTSTLMRIGSESGYSSNANGMFVANKIEFDETTYVTKAIYTYSGDASAIPFTKDLAVKPNTFLTYNGDEIKDAIKITVKDGDTVVTSKSYDVKVVYDTTSNGYYHRYYNYYPSKGVKDFRLTNFYISARAFGLDYLPSRGATIDEMIITLPDVVEKITKVTREHVYGNADDLTWSYENSTNTLTVKNVHLDDQNKRSNSGNTSYTPGFTIYGDIKDDATVDQHFATKQVYAKGHFYDGETFEYFDGTFMNHPDTEKTYWIRIKAGEGSNVSVPGDSGWTRAIKRVDGYPTRLGTFGDEIFYCNVNTVDDQIVTWEFDPTHLDVVGVLFPVQLADKITITSLTYIDATGSQKTVSLNIDIPNNASMYDGINYGEYSGRVVYTNINDLKARSTDVPSDAKYIKSITANCGKFESGYSSRIQGQGTIAVGYIKQADIDQKPSASTPIKSIINYTVNGKTTAITHNYAYDLRMDISARTTANKNVVVAGEDVNFTSRVRINFGRDGTVVEEPDLIIVVPKYFTFNPNSVTAQYFDRSATGTDVTRNVVVEGPFTSKNAAGNTYYVLHVPGTVLSYFGEKDNIQLRLDNNTPDGKRRFNQIVYNYTMSVDITSGDQDIDLSNYMLAGKRMLDGTKNYYFNAPISSVGHIKDIWDLNENGAFNESHIARSESSGNLKVSEDKAIIVDGYLTQEVGSGAVAVYDPGADGSSDKNAVTFSTGTKAQYHVVVRNTNTDTTNGSGKIEAYIPIPKATISGSNIKPKNTGKATGNLAVGESTNYQFNNYAWPMALASKVADPDPSRNYVITYWLGDVELDAYSKPKNNNTNVKRTNADIKDAELAQVSLIEIRSDNIPANYNADGKIEFILELKVGINASQANETNANGTKNIFRPYFSRQNQSGTLNASKKGNYVAAKLSVAELAGKAFYDKNGNGLFDTGDSALSGTKVSLYKVDKGVETLVKLPDSQLNPTTTEADGTYSFKDMGIGDYIIRFENTNAARGFSNTIADEDVNYTVNSDAKAASDHKTADIQVTLPYSGVANNAMLFLNAGYVDKLTVKFENNNSAKGSFAPTTDQSVFKGHAVTLPTPAPNSPYKFDAWKDGSKEYKAGDPINANTTLTAYWTNRVQFTNSNGSAGSISNNLDQQLSNGAKLTALPTHTPNTGYSFEGWQLNGKVLTDDQLKQEAINGDVTITAKWSNLPTFTITYTDGVDNEEVFADQIKTGVLQGSTTPAFTGTPTRNGYSFVKWTPDVAATVTANATYTATWKEETYTITYNGVENASNPNPVSYKISETPKPLLQPTKDYYDFLGWTGANGTTAQRNVTIPQGKTGNLTYTANWKATDYTIDYDLAGGVAPATANPTSYNVTSAAIKLNNPTRNGYTFAGWIGTGLSAASTSVTIPNNSHGDRKYTATWTKNTYKLTYVWKDNTVANDPVTVASHTNPATFTVDDLLPLEFVAPNVNGYSFVSFDIPKLTVSSIPVDPTNPITITGTFEPITYTITYVLGDGATNGTGNPDSYTIKDAAITLSDPSRPGYTFKNWKEGNSIPAASTGNKTFTAVWDTVDYNITYSYKDEANNPISQGVVNYNPDTYNADELPLTFNKKDVSLEGYTFEGFTPARLAAGTTGDQTVVGTFKAKLYTVKYNTDGGTAVTAKTNVKWNQADLAPALTASTKAGSTLKGWTYNDVDYDASETYGDLAQNDGTTSITLKAKWEDKTFTVKYDTKGGTAISNKTVKWNDTGLTNGIPTLAGSTLDGWKIVGGPKNGQTYNNEAYKDLVADDSTTEIKLEAIWKAKTYRVVYDTDGGTKVGDDKIGFNDKLDNTKVTTKKGFTFLGWFLEFLGVNNTNNKQYNQETYSTIVNGDDTEMSVTLYAGWKENIYTVHYLDKDGNTIASDNTVTFGQAPVTPGNTPEKEGHTFKGWFTNKALTTGYNNEAYAKLVNDDDTVGQVTLYGKFDPVEFSVSFDGNNGVGIMDPIDVTYNDGTKAPNSGFSRRGYNFVSYNTKRDGSGVEYKVGDDISKLANKEGKNVTLYAQWQIINYKITYNWNDADPSVSKVKNKADTTLFPDTYTVLDQITLGTPLRDGYTFKGWTPNNGKIDLNTIGDLTFTAAWEVINYDIVYDLNDAGSVSTATNNAGNPDTYTIEDDITLLAPSRTGYTFKGWTPDNGKISKPSMGTKTFTATWEVIEYPITYNLNDAGSVSKATNNPGNPATYTVEDEITLQAPTRNGYTFKAWTPTNKIAKNTTGPLTFTATWDVINYDIVYDLNDTTGSTKAVNDANNPATYTIEQTVTPVAASRPGYTFVDWTPASVGPNATGTQTFVADWIANTYTIEFIGLDGTTVISSVPAIFDQTVKTKAPDAKSAGLEAELKAKKEDLEGWEDANTGIIYKPGDEINIPTGQNGKVQLKAVTVAFTYDVYAGDNQVWTKGSNDGLKFIFKRSRLDNLTYTNFVNNGEMVEVDGSAIAGFTASEGSLILELPASYLRACSATTHTVTVYFSDGGQASANFTVRNQPITPNPNPYNLPKTGVDNMPTNNVLSGLYLLGVLGLVTAIASKKK